jgi:hypothetical protein
VKDGSIITKDLIHTVYLMTLFNSIGLIASNGRTSVNVEFQIIWKQAIVAYLKYETSTSTKQSQGTDSPRFETGNSRIQRRNANYSMYRGECTPPVETEENKEKTAIRGKGFRMRFEVGYRFRSGRHPLHRDLRLSIPNKQTSQLITLTEPTRALMRMNHQL